MKKYLTTKTLPTRPHVFVAGFIVLSLCLYGVLVAHQIKVAVTDAGSIDEEVSVASYLPHPNYVFAGGGTGSYYSQSAYYSQSSYVYSQSSYYSQSLYYSQSQYFLYSQASYTTVNAQTDGTAAYIVPMQF